MKNKKILKDILKLHPELEKDKSSLKKTVRFLSMIKPKVAIDAEFRSDLWKKLSTLAALKSESVESLSSKPWFLHIFGWVFASMLAFFGLFYVFGDTLFYIWDTSQMSEYETQFLDTDIIQETKLEIEQSGNISEPSTPIEKETILESQTSELPHIIIIDQDGRAQEDVWNTQRLQPKISTTETVETQTIIHENIKEDTQADTSVENTEFKDDTSTVDQLSWEKDDNIWGTISIPIIEPSSIQFESKMDTNSDTNADLADENIWNLDTMLAPAAWSMMAPEMMWDINTIQEDVPDAIEEISDVEQESYDDVLDEFTLRCDVFGGEVSIKDDIRVCNIWDIVCTESDFLKWVCELGQ